jgi:hypothetical protein
MTDPSLDAVQFIEVNCGNRNAFVAALRHRHDLSFSILPQA